MPIFHTKIIKNKFVLYTASNIIYAASQWAFIFLTLRMFDAEKTGELTIGLAINAPIFLLLNMQLRNDYIKEKSEEKFNTYLLVRIISNIIACIIVTTYSLIKISNIDSLTTILLISAIKSIEGLSDIRNAKRQLNENYCEISISTLIKSAAYSITYAISSYITNNLHISLLLIIAHLLVSYYTIDNKIQINSNKSKKNNTNNLFQINPHTNESINEGGCFYLKKIIVTQRYKDALFLIKKTYKLGMGSSLDSLTINSQRIILASKLGLETLGIYASLMQLIIIPQIILTSINQYLFAKINSQKNRSTIKIYSAAFIAGILAILILMYFQQGIIELIYNGHEDITKDLLLVVAFCGLFWYISGATNIISIARNKYSIYIYSLLISLIITILFTYILTELYGVIGAALALLSGYAIRIIATIIFDEKNENSK